MRKEIGSEFWDIPLGRENGFFPKEVQWFSSGRSALSAILKQRSMESVSLPSWCCDSMIIPFVEAGIRVEFYPVYFEDGLVTDLSSVRTDAVLVLDYFGFTQQQSMDCSGIVIRDVTHSVFSKTHTDADHYFGSLRKWAGFWTGGYGWGFQAPNIPEDTCYVQLRKRAMEEKSRYINGSSDSKEYLKIFSQAEQLLDEQYYAGAADKDVERAFKLDVEFIKKRRRANAKHLLEAFSDWAIFPSMAEEDCPLFVPVLVPDGKRDALRSYLIRNEIYCPVHWPVSEYHKIAPKCMSLFENELSLVCDHRYTLQDMDRLIGTVNDFLKGNV